MPNYGRNIRYYRFRAGLTQKELARAIGWSVGVGIGLYEKGREGFSNPSVGLLERIAAAVGCTVADLIAESLPEDAVCVLERSALYHALAAKQPALAQEISRAQAALGDVLEQIGTLERQIDQLKAVRDEWRRGYRDLKREQMRFLDLDRRWRKRKELRA